MADQQKPAREACLDELRHIEEDATYSARGHFEAATSWGRRRDWLGLPAAVISAVAGVSILADSNLVIAGVLALVAAALGGANAFLNPGERAATHLAFGNDFNSLRNRSRIARTIEAPGLDDEGLPERVVKLSGERDSLNKKAPQIPRVSPAS